MLFGFVEVWVQWILTARIPPTASFQKTIPPLCCDAIWEQNGFIKGFWETTGLLPQLELKPVSNERGFWAELCFEGACLQPSHRAEASAANVSARSPPWKTTVSAVTRPQGRPIFMFLSDCETQPERKKKTYILFIITCKPVLVVSFI